jgi:hypothetical protein
MRRREFITLLGGAAATWPILGHTSVLASRYILAQFETEKVLPVGFTSLDRHTSQKARLQAHAG